MKETIKTELIRNFIKEQHLSKTKFCKLCKISPSTFHKIMKNDFHFHTGAFFRIAKVMKIEVVEIFDEQRYYKNC